MEVQRQVAEALSAQFTPDGIVVKALEWALKKEVGSTCFLNDQCNKNEYMAVYFIVH